MQCKTGGSPGDIHDGFIGVERKLTGVAENVKENQILSNLEQRNITPTYISMFRSRRRGTISARIHIPSGSCALVQKENFWPKFVGCTPWRSKEYDSKTAERQVNVTLDGIYSTYA